MIKAEEVINQRKYYLSKEGKKSRWFDRCNKLATYEGVTINSLLEERGIDKFLVYGFNEFAKMLIRCSQANRHNCLGIIDQNADKIDILFPVYSLKNIPADVLNSVDAIVVCVVLVNEELISNVRNATNIDVVKFEDLIYEI